MHIVCTLDDNYLIPTSVLLTSICENNKEADITIHIVAQDLKKESVAALRDVVEGRYKKSISFYFPELDFLKEWNLYSSTQYLSIATFFRLFLSSILPVELEKVLYLDCDIVVRKSLSDLWNTSLDGAALAAAEDEGCGKLQKEGYLEKLNLDSHSIYFNAGVLLVNLKYWRENKLEKRYLEYFEKHNYQLLYNDQDVLNGVLSQENKSLPLTYNLSENFYRKKRRSRPEVWAEADSLLSNPHIMHFTGDRKPWLATCLHPMQDEYFKYLDQTKWKGLRPNVNPLTKVRHYFKRLKKFRKID